MAKIYFKALKTINFTDTGVTLPSGKVFYVESSEVFSYSRFDNKVVSVSQMGDWISRLEPQLFVEKTDSLVFKEYVSSFSNIENKKTAKPSSTTYQDITTSVPEILRAQPKSGHQAFIRPLANLSFNSPKAEVGAVPSPKVEIPTIKTATVETPTGKRVMDLTKGAEVSEARTEVGNRFSVVDIPEGKEATPVDLDSLYKENRQDVDGMYSLVESIEVAVTDTTSVSKFEKQWDSYMSLRKKADKLDFIDGLTYPGVLQFFIEKTKDLITQAEEGKYNLSKPMQKMHHNILKTMEMKLKVGRLDV